MVGRICDIVEAKGFFFIRVDQEGRKPVDYFAHRSALRGGVRFEELSVGTPVEFVEDPHPQRGPRAEEVRLVPEI